MTPRRLPARAWLVLAVLALPSPALAHQVDAATLSLVEVADGRFSIKWQAGSSSLQEELTQPALFPAHCRLRGTYLECGQSGLVGAIQFPWLPGTLTHVLVDIEWRDHSRLLRSVAGDAPSITVYGPSSHRKVVALLTIARDYTMLGLEHIAGGFDHLMFVSALTLLVPFGRRLLLTITAFTLAHSLSLAVTVLGVVQLPAPPVEAIIAGSIVLACAEAARPSDSITKRAPWLVAFAFGLLHGLGFAAALLELGLPEGHVPLALGFFNVGVELGQLAIVGAIVALGLLARRLGASSGRLERAVLYGMGTVAALWTLERLVAVGTG